MLKILLLLSLLSFCLCHKNICNEPTFGFIYPEAGTATTNISCSNFTTNTLLPTQYNAMVAFYHSFKGNLWINQGQWLNSNISYCQWGGITCDNNCMIAEIFINQNNLHGVFPSESKDLINLRLLNLACNFISGGTKNLANLTNISILALSSNLINDNMTFVKDLTKLQALELDNNYIQGEIPVEITRFNDLSILDLSSNLITGIIPPEFVNLIKMETLYLASNSLTGTISKLFDRMKFLKSIGLSNNNFYGELPRLGGKLLTWVDFSCNNLTGEIPKSWYNSHFLFNVRLDNNILSGEISNSLNNLYFAHFINISSNLFYGELPNLYYLMCNTLIINNNNITGSLDMNFGTTTYLDIRNNSLMQEKYSIKRYHQTESVVINRNMACPYLLSNNYRTLILVDPSYYDHIFCYQLL